MVDFVEFRDLENIANSDTKEFLRLLNSCIEKNGIDYSIRALISSGICVDIYGSGKYKRLYQESVEILKAFCGEDSEKVKELESSVELFEILFSQFNSLRLISGFDVIPMDHQIPAFLLTSEILLGSLIDYSKGNTLEDVSIRYPSVIGFIDEKGNLAEPKEVYFRLLEMFDAISENIGLILKYLMFCNAPLSGLDIEIPFNEIIVSRDHIFLFPIYKQIMRNYDLWRYWGGKITKSNENKIYFEPEQKDSYLANLISSGRLRSLRMKFMNEFSLIDDQIKCVPDSKILPPTQLRLPEEALDCIFCKDLFGSDDFSEPILGVSLAEWIRAYTTLKQSAIDYVENRDAVRPFTLSDWCIV